MAVEADGVLLVSRCYLTGSHYHSRISHSTDASWLAGRTRTSITRVRVVMAAEVSNRRAPILFVCALMSRHVNFPCKPLHDCLTITAKS